jgi:murein DD-endopeptidase MepM/ murein hydrolase activator NlpD
VPSTDARDGPRRALRSPIVGTVRRLLLVVLALCLCLIAPVPAVAEPAVPALAALWTRPLPVPAPVTRSFEPPPHPYAAGHRGVDLGGAPGTPVLAAGDGVVAFAGMVAGRPVVSVDHADGLRTTYEPVDPSVGAGTPVARGSPIGTLLPGHAGCPVEACLHWGLRRGATYLDPLSLLEIPRISLLPLG